MTNLLVAVTLLWPCQGPELKRLGYVESRNTSTAVGDHGKSFGEYQMQKPAWRAACKKLRQLKIQTKPIECYKDSQVARPVAAAYIMVLTDSYVEATGKQPDWFDLYVLWNRGCSGYKRMQFNQQKVPEPLAKKARYVRGH